LNKIFFIPFEKFEKSLKSVTVLARSEAKPRKLTTVFEFELRALYLQNKCSTA
jgi:hypothetical protein